MTLQAPWGEMASLHPLSTEKEPGVSLYCCLVAKLCPTLCDLMDCIVPGSFFHGISQASILE